MRGGSKSPAQFLTTSNTHNGCHDKYRTKDFQKATKKSVKTDIFILCNQ